MVGVHPIVPRVHKKKLIKRKREVITQITQGVTFTITFPSCELQFYSRFEDKIVVNTKPIQSYKYGFMLKSVINGYNCKPLIGEELFNNAIKQNETTYHKLINECIDKYKSQTGIKECNFVIEKYETPQVERAYVTETKEYYEEV